MRRGALVVVVVAAAATPAHADPLTLQAAVDTALGRHPEIEIARSAIESAVAQIELARTATRPTVSFSASARDDYQNPGPIVDDPPGFLKSESVNVQLTANKLLTDFGFTSWSVRSAEANVREARTQLTTTQLDLEQRVVQAYLEVLHIQQNIAVSEEAITLVQAQLDQATALFKATLRPEIDVLSAQTQLEQANLSLIADKNTLANDLLSLRTAMGVTAKDARPIEVVPVGIRALDEESKKSDDVALAVVSHRTELTALQEGVVAAEAALEVARRESTVGPRYSLSVSGGAFMNQSRAHVLPYFLVDDAPSGGVFASLAFNWSVYSPATAAQIHTAESNLRHARAAYTDTQLSLETGIGQAFLAVQLAREQLEVTTTLRGHAERQLELAKQRYDTKVGSFVEFNDARTGLVNAKRQEVDARFRLAQSRVSLARQLGLSPTKLAVAP